MFKLFKKRKSDRVIFREQLELIRDNVLEDIGRYSTYGKKYEDKVKGLTRALETIDIMIDFCHSREATDLPF